MQITINYNELSIEGEENDEKVIYKTTLNDEEKEKFEKDNNIQEFTLVDREWKVCYPASSKKDYLRLGILQ